MDQEEKNIKRVDKRPASLYSVIIFILVFTIGYFLYPQLSMVLPIPGTKLTVKTSYQPVAVTDMMQAEYIVVATVTGRGKTVSGPLADNMIEVYTPVEFTPVAVLKGQVSENFTLPQYGGNALLEGRKGHRAEKYTVTYPDAATFENGKTYLLFIDENRQVINGRYGALLRGENGTFTDAFGNIYTLDQLQKLIKEEP